MESSGFDCLIRQEEKLETAFLALCLQPPAKVLHFLSSVFGIWKEVAVSQPTFFSKQK